MSSEPPTPDLPAPQTAQPQLARSAGVIGAATMSSRVLGLARDVILANQARADGYV